MCSFANCRSPIVKTTFTKNANNDNNLEFVKFIYGSFFEDYLDKLKEQLNKYYVLDNVCLHVLGLILRSNVRYMLFPTFSALKGRPFYSFILLDLKKYSEYLKAIKPSKRTNT